jgi:hypothetical protein
VARGRRAEGRGYGLILFASVLLHRMIGLIAAPELPGR